MVSETSSNRRFLDEMDSQQGATLGQRRSLVFLAMVFAIVVGLTSGCFITNCPPGGKRSDSSLGMIPIRPCSRCGFRGRCFGPAICCSPSTGCLVADRGSIHPLLRPCAIEAALPGICMNSGKPCGSSGGRCASDGICCDNVSCSTDSSCRISTTSMVPAYIEKIRGSALEELPQIKDYSESYGGLEGSLSRF